MNNHFLLLLHILLIDTTVIFAVVDVGPGNPATLQRRQSMRSLETMFATSALAPRVEGRISMAPSQVSTVLEREL